MTTNEFKNRTNELREEYISLCGRPLTNDEYKRKIQLNGFLKTLQFDFNVGGKND